MDKWEKEIQELRLLGASNEKANAGYLLQNVPDQSWRTCEICGAPAMNIAEEQAIEVNNGTGIATAASTAPMVFSDTRSYCHGRRVMNFLLGCMVFAFIISWFFHFKILP
ncbi:unnamed protein product [Coffea canephora]|uniref:DH200=94 genomic scaffold, scaffold_11681 n=1 Tax=Coffea canephora TaxID=49390 RepID=A0A068VNE6_COFCA|nr:unnamed protein product [Coffea canephora]